MTFVTLHQISKKFVKSGPFRDSRKIKKNTGIWIFKFISYSVLYLISLHLFAIASIHFFQTASKFEVPYLEKTAFFIKLSLSTSSAGRFRNRLSACLFQVPPPLIFIKIHMILFKRIVSTNY